MAIYWSKKITFHLVEEVSQVYQPTVTINEHLIADSVAVSNLP